MSIYQYKCMLCGHEWQDGAVEKCPSCGSMRLGQAHAVANYQFSGEGYARDPIARLRNDYEAGQ